jgi:hypothetical protein
MNTCLMRLVRLEKVANVLTNSEADEKSIESMSPFPNSPRVLEGAIIGIDGELQQ